MPKDKQYVGVAPLTMVRTDPGGYVNVFAGDPVPVTINADDLDRLVKEGFLAEDKSSSSSSEAAGDGKPTSVKDILKEVGDDKAKAQEYLDAENAAETPRVSLVEGLQKVIDAEA